MKKFEKKQIVLIILCFVYLLGIISFINLFPSLVFKMKEACAIAIIGGDDGPTTILSNYNILFIIFAVSVFLAIDILKLAVIKKIGNQKVINKKYIILIILNTIIALLIIPSMILIIIIYNGIIVFTVIGKYIFQKYLRKQKNN